jgi:hypothetical protein
MFKLIEEKVFKSKKNPTNIYYPDLLLEFCIRSIKKQMHRVFINILDIDLKLSTIKKSIDSLEKEIKLADA